MESLFLKLIELSITGSLFVLAVLLLRLIFRKAPKWVFCLLWGVVALRLIVPVSIESSFSLIPDTLTDEKIAAQMAQDYVGDVTFIYEGAEDYQAAVEAGRQPIHQGGDTYVVTEKGSYEEPATVGDTVLPVLCWIWIAGMATMVVYTVTSFLVLKRRVSTATILEGNIRQSEQVESPFVLGFIRPEIYLPYDLDEKDMANVIAHERSHIQRRDHWWKPIGFLILSIHWFNPVMWLAYILLCRDIEAACDEKVIREMDLDGIRAYSTALLNCSIHRRRIAACPLAFGEVGVKERIKRVMHYKKPAFWLVLLALVASIVASVLLLTTPVSGDQMLMGAYYHIGEELYDVQDENNTRFSRFLITGDYYFTAQQEGRDTWISRKQMEAYPLTAEKLESFATEEGWKTRYRIGEITDAYLLKKEINHFYIAARTKNGDTLLAFGSGDPEGALENPAKLLWLYKLESDFTPHEIDLDFVAQSLVGEAGGTEIIEVWESEENPGFMVAGFLAGPNFDEKLGYDDMGYAVFQTDGTGYRLLSCEIYEDAVYSESGIFFCPGPAVLSLDGEATDSNSFDVILSCNENLSKIQREYYKDDTMVMNVAAMQLESSSMHLFRWDLCKEANRVAQVYLDKNGNEIAVKTQQEKILELVDRIVNNVSVALSSNPYDYIKAKQELYDEILSYGETAVDCLAGYLRSTDADGLREYIMAAACAEITGIGKDKNTAPWSSGKTWLELYGGNILGTHEDEVGASIDVESLLGINCVWKELSDTRFDLRTNRYLDTYRFYYKGDGKDYYTGTQKAETDLVTVKDCIQWKTGDFDHDGIVELFVWTDDAAEPYWVYDLDGSKIIENRFVKIPDMVIDYEILFEWEGLYLYEEKWAWFFKEPVTYIRELARLPENRLYSGCPSGIIPEKFDHALIENAYQKLSDWLSSPRTTYEKQIGYKIMTAMEYTYVPEMIPGQINYTMLFEKWGFTAMPSTEEQNCYNQILACFEADPVGFLRGMTEPAGATWCKDLFFVAAELARVNCLYDRSAYEQVLNRLENVASTDEEKASVELLRECYEAWESPNLDANTLANCSGTELWNAFFYDPVTTLNVLGNCKEEQLKYLGQKLWDSAYWAQKLLDKGYDAVNGILDGNPTGALKDVAYKFLVHLEWEGGYSQEYIPGYPFDYWRLFDKWTYSDGAMATSCNYQMFAVFEADPKGFMATLAQWDKTAQEGRDMEAIARSFAYQYQGDDSYLQILTDLLDEQATLESAKTFVEESKKLTSE